MVPDPSVAGLPVQVVMVLGRPVRQGKLCNSDAGLPVQWLERPVLPNRSYVLTLVGLRQRLHGAGRRVPRALSLACIGFCTPAGLPSLPLAGDVGQQVHADGPSIAMKDHRLLNSCWTWTWLVGHAMHLLDIFRNQLDVRRCSAGQCGRQRKLEGMSCLFKYMSSSGAQKTWRAHAQLHTADPLVSLLQPLLRQSRSLPIIAQQRQQPPRCDGRIRRR